MSILLHRLFVSKCQSNKDIRLLKHLAANVYGEGNIEMAAELIEGSPADIACDMYPYNVWATDISSAVFDGGFSKFNFDEKDIELLTGEHAGEYCTQELFTELRTSDKTLQSTRSYCRFTVCKKTRQASAIVRQMPVFFR